MNIKHLNFKHTFNVSEAVNQSTAVSFDRNFTCDLTYHPHGFDWSSLLMIIAIVILIVPLSKFGRIYSFKIIMRTRPKQQYHGTYEDDNIFQGFFLNKWTSLLYILLGLGASIVQYIYGNILSNAYQNTSNFIIFLLTCHFFDEVIFLIPKVKLLKKPLLAVVRLCDMIAIFLALVINYLYFHYQKPWPISDFLSMCCMGSLIKLFKIKSLKTAVEFITPYLLINTIFCVYLSFQNKFEWADIMSTSFNTPFSVQVPFFQNTYANKCGWISIINILFPSFFIGYCLRLDSAKNIYIYQIVSVVGLFLGFLVWLILQWAFKFPIPISFCSNVPMILLSVQQSNKRSEIRMFWNGMFYDKQLFEPYADQAGLQEDSTRSVNCYYGNHSFATGQRDKSEDEFDAQPKLVDNTVSGKYNIHGGIFQGLTVEPQQAQVQQQQTILQSNQEPFQPQKQSQQVQQNGVPSIQDINNPNQHLKQKSLSGGGIHQNPAFAKFNNPNAKPVFPTK